MRLFSAVVVVIILTLARGAAAQTETQDVPDNPTPVVVTQPPMTGLDSLNQAPGLTRRSLNRVGEMTDDAGGVLTVYTVTIEQHGKDAAGTPYDNVRTGLSLVATSRAGVRVRAYVDADHVGPMLEGIAALTEIDRSGPQTAVRGVYRDSTVTVSNIDDASGRTAVVLLLQITPITNQATFAAVRFRSTRLNELSRQLKTAKDVLEKAGK